MEIYKILNNNVIVSKNEHDKEIIAMGKGIAFKKKVGEHIEDELIDKVYTLSDEVSSKFQELAAEIPVEHMKISDDIIKYVKLKLGKKLNDSIYLSLCDHISTAILRHEEGVDVKNVLLWDIKKFYKDEFEIDDTDLFTKFFIGGQMAVMNCNKKDIDEKIEFLRGMLNKLKK